MVVIDRSMKLSGAPPLEYFGYRRSRELDPSWENCPG